MALLLPRFVLLISFSFSFLLLLLPFFFFVNVKILGGIIVLGILFCFMLYGFVWMDGW
jgi:hypothetical protein